MFCASRSEKMSDDLDALLDELDTGSPEQPSRAAKANVFPDLPSPTKYTGGLEKVAKGGDAIDDLLDDLDDDTPVHLREQAAPTRATPAEEVGEVGVKMSGKCFPVYIGGTDCELGMSPGRTCDALRCTKCDFSVIRIKDMRWTDACDYLFFRNFYPDQAKLKANLRAAKGMCSYACQCTWRSTDSLDMVGSDIRWTCGGHGK